MHKQVTTCRLYKTLCPHGIREWVGVLQVEGTNPQGTCPLAVSHPTTCQLDLHRSFADYWIACNMFGCLFVHEILMVQLGWQDDTGMSSQVLEWAHILQLNFTMYQAGLGWVWECSFWGIVLFLKEVLGMVHSNHHMEAFMVNQQWQAVQESL